jgi:rhodanese-related sulfurtransferase
MEIKINDINHSFFSLIIDIRNKEQYDKYHMDGSINIPFYNLITNPDQYLDKNKTYLIVCDYGLKSKKTSEILNNMGYLTKSICGGIKEYQRFYDDCKKK